MATVAPPEELNAQKPGDGMLRNGKQGDIYQHT